MARPLSLAGWGWGRTAVAQADSHSPFLREEAGAWVSWGQARRGEGCGVLGGAQC